MRISRCLLLLGLYATSCLATAAEIEVITLKYRSAEQLIPMIRPLIAPGGSVSGMQNQLILRTNKANLEDIRKVLERVDTLPRRLMIYVRQEAEGTSAQRLRPAHRRCGTAQGQPPHLGQGGRNQIG